MPSFSNPVFRKAVAEIESLGVQVSDRKIPGAIPYGIMGGRSNQRWWLIPLANSHVAANGMALFQPILKSAKFLKSIAVGASHIGLSSLWARDRIYIKGCPHISEFLLPDGGYCAYFTGTDSPHRKLAVQFMDGQGGIRGFAKVTKSSAIKALLEHEAATLNHLNKLGLRAAYIPNVLFCGQQQDAHVLITDTLKTGSARTTTSIQNTHLAFLEELFEKTEENQPLRGGWIASQLEARYSEISTQMNSAWRRRLEHCIEYISDHGRELCSSSISHGDFTPWNTFYTGCKLYVFDWEYADNIHPLGYDLIHFMLSQPLAGQWNPSLIFERILSKIEKTWYTESRSTAKAVLMAYFCGHTLRYAGRAVNTNVGTIEWDGAERIANLIDESIARRRVGLI